MLVRPPTTTFPRRRRLPDLVEEASYKLVTRRHTGSPSGRSNLAHWARRSARRDAAEPCQQAERERPWRASLDDGDGATLRCQRRQLGQLGTACFGPASPAISASRSITPCARTARAISRRSSRPLAPDRGRACDRFAIVSSPRTGRFRDRADTHGELLCRGGGCRKPLVQGLISSVPQADERGTQDSNLESPVLETRRSSVSNPP